MRITIRPEVTEGRCGILARSAELGLCGCGHDEQAALDNLAHGVRIWAKALRSEGSLGHALDKSGLVWSDGDTNGAIGVEFAS